MYLHLYLFISFCNKHNICYMCWCYVQRGRLKNELVNLRALKILTWYKNHIFQCMDALWNSIQNILSILWKVRNLLRSDLSAFLRARKRFWSPPPPPPPPDSQVYIYPRYIVTSALLMSKTVCLNTVHHDALRHMISHLASYMKVYWRLSYSVIHDDDV